jgi:hypothetical protein
VPTTAVPAGSPDDAEDEDAAQARAALDKARNLARARAVELAQEEQAHLLKLAKETAAKDERWAAAVQRFYGHFAGKITKGLVCEKAAAKAWCEARRGLVLREGLSGLVGVEAIETLVALSLNGGSEC